MNLKMYTYKLRFKGSPVDVLATYLASSKRHARHAMLRDVRNKTLERKPVLHMVTAVGRGVGVNISFLPKDVPKKFVPEVTKDFFERLEQVPYKHFDPKDFDEKYYYYG